MEKFEEEIRKAHIDRAQAIAKSFQSEGEDVIQKGKAATVGEIREWGGKKYKKQGNGKWMEVSTHGMTRGEHEHQLKEITPLSEEDKKLTNRLSQVRMHEKYAKNLSDKEHDESELSGEKKQEKLGSFSVGEEVDYVVPGESNEVGRGKIENFKSSRDEDFAVINGKNISFDRLSKVK